jgi:hypothetical protein
MNVDRREGAAQRYRTRFPPGTGTFLLASALLSAILLGLLLRETGGAFGYSLDDPYIDLALAERILHGHYGLNMNEAAAPASSILFPFLLAALLKLGLGQVAPLAVNLLATALSVGLLGALAAEAGIDLARAPAARLVLAAFVVLLGLNLIGLAFTGLEHALHVADTLACLLGIVRTVRTGRMPRWLPIVLVLNPLIRFEGLSVWGAGMIVLGLERKRSGAFITLVLGLVTVGGYCWYLHHLGLPLLPSSVLVKSRAAGSTSATRALRGVILTLLENLGKYGAPQLLVALALLLALARDQSRRNIALFACLPILAHLLAGAFGWFGRYEIYVLTLAWSAVAVLYGGVVARGLTGPWPGFAAGLALWLAMHASYASTTFLTARAAEEIHLQQFQMHRFAVDFYRAPVAVNDLGWVSYGNPNYVLDLYGLGSEAARIARSGGNANPSWMEDLARQHHVDVAMIYTPWFPALPELWTAVGALTLDRAPVAVALPMVTFYATTPAAVPALRDALTRFAPTVPAGVRLTLR